MTDISNLIRQSEFTSFQSCRRQHHFAYTRNLVPLAEGRRMPAKGHRDEGSAAHKGAEVLHLGGTVEEATEAATAFVNELRAIRHDGPLPELTKADDEEWWKVDRLGRTMVEGYAEWLADTGFDAGYETLAVEHSWEHEIPGTLGLRAYGQIDLVLRDTFTNGIIIDDMKSVANFSQTPMPVDFQLRTYAWAWWKESGEVPRTARHRMMRRVLRGPKAKAPFYDVYGIHINQEILEKHEQILSYRALDIGQIRLYGEDATHPALYPNPTKDCSWRCPFQAICPMVDEGDDYESVIEQYFTVKTEKE